MTTFYGQFNDQIFKRTTQSKVYEYVVLVKDGEEWKAENWCGRLDLARTKGKTAIKYYGPAGVEIVPVFKIDEKTLKERQAKIEEIKARAQAAREAKEAAEPEFKHIEEAEIEKVEAQAAQESEEIRAENEIEASIKQHEEEEEEAAEAADARIMEAYYKAKAQEEADRFKAEQPSATAKRDWPAYFEKIEEEAAQAVQAAQALQEKAEEVGARAPEGEPVKLEEFDEIRTQISSENAQALENIETQIRQIAGEPEAQEEAQAIDGIQAEADSLLDQARAANAAGDTGALIGAALAFINLLGKLTTEMPEDHRPALQKAIEEHQAEAEARAPKYAPVPYAPSLICKKCGKLLTGPESVARGYGDKCWRQVWKFVRGKEEPNQADPARPTILNPETARTARYEIKRRIRAAGETCPHCEEQAANGELWTYDHDGGYRLPGYENPQWIYTQCPKCGYQYSLRKMRDIDIEDLETQGRAEAGARLAEEEARLAARAAQAAHNHGCRAASEAQRFKTPQEARQ